MARPLVLDAARVSLSQDGKTYEPVASVSCQVSEGERGPLIKTVAVRAEGRQARYVRVQARNRGELPAGIPAADRRAWLFVDEIESHTQLSNHATTVIVEPPNTSPEKRLAPR